MERINTTSQNHHKHDETPKTDKEIGFPSHKSSSDLISRNNNNKIHNSEGLPTIDHEDDDFYNGNDIENQNSSSPGRLTKSNSLSSIIPPKFQNLSDLSRQQQQQHPVSAEPKSLPAPNKFTAFFAKFAKKNNNNNNNESNSSSQVVSSAKYQTNTPQFIPKKKKTTSTITTSIEDRKRETRESRMIACAKIWKESDVISNWNKRKLSKKTRELIWWGVPPNVRSHVWPLFIGNKLSLTRELFDIYMMQAGRTKTRSSENNIGKESTVHLIPIDLPRTFPHLSFFHPEGPLYSQLRDVLEAYACYRPDIGYVQGMSYLASMFLLYMDSLSSFICLANILNRPLLMGFYRMENAQINNFIKTLNLMLEIYLPNLHKHFSSMQITPEVYIMDWVMTLFSKSFELDVVSRIWDTLLFEGEFFIIKVGIGLLKVSESILLANNYEECLIYLTHLPSIEEDALFDAISSFDFRACKVVDDYLSFLSVQSSTY